MIVRNNQAVFFKVRIGKYQKKLAKCSPSTLNVASKMIDILLEQQDSLSAE